METLEHSWVFRPTLVDKHPTLVDLFEAWIMAVGSIRGEIIWIGFFLVAIWVILEGEEL